MLVLTAVLLLVLFGLWLLPVLAFAVFVAVGVEGAVVSPANAGMVNEKTTIDANKKLSSFFMFFLLLGEFFIRPC